MTEPADTYPTVTPYLIVPDAESELVFLKTAFGAIEKAVHRDGNRVMHAELTIGDSLVMLGQSNEQFTPLTAALYLWVDDVDATYAAALAAGGTSVSEPEDKPYGHRNAGVVDANSITWWIGALVK